MNALARTRSGPRRGRGRTAAAPLGFGISDSERSIIIVVYKNPKTTFLWLRLVLELLVLKDPKACEFRARGGRQCIPP